MAGVTGMPRWRFTSWSALGGLLSSGSFILVGYFFSSQLERIGYFSERLGNGLRLSLRSLSQLISYADTSSDARSCSN